MSYTKLSATPFEYSHDPDYHPTYPDEISEKSDSNAEVINRLQSPLPSTIRYVATKRLVSTDNKSINIKNSVHHGEYFIALL